ncbi:MAG TPA: hypothetical protein VHX14_02260 [Thermoanaerobaculia bacterium]|nr:hypothetical protein [Thermoanaerobaculia bacterium]
METMTLERIVDRALAKSVWVRAAITNMDKMCKAYRSPSDADIPDEQAARRHQRKIDYWTVEREAVDHALSAAIDIRRRILAAVPPPHRQRRSESQIPANGLCSTLDRLIESGRKARAAGNGLRRA